MDPTPSTLHQSAILMDYLPKLVRLAERNMSRRLLRKVGPDDIANSIIGSVFRMVREEKIHIDQSEGFWKLMVVIGLNKIRKKSRYYNAAKRDQRLEVNLAEDLPTLEELASDRGDPLDEDGEAIGRVLEALLDQLDEDCKIVFDGKLNGDSLHDIAGRIGKSTRTVSRCWNSVEEEARRIAKEMDLI